jgi:heme exporter protein D
MDLGPHAFFIVAAYVVTALIVAGLIGRAVLDHRAQLRALADLEDRGIRRLSDEREGFGEARPEIQRPPVQGVR